MAPTAEMHFAKLCVRGAAGSCCGCGSIRAAGAAGAVAPGEGAEVPGRSVARRTGPAPGQLLKIRQATPAATTTPNSGHIRLDDFVGRSERSHAAIASWGRPSRGRVNVCLPCFGASVDGLLRTVAARPRGYLRLALGQSDGGDEPVGECAAAIRLHLGTFFFRFVGMCLAAALEPWRKGVFSTGFGDGFRARCWLASFSNLVPGFR